MTKTPKKAPPKAAKAQAPKAPVHVTKPADKAKPKAKGKGKGRTGRPTIMVPEVLKKVERAFMGGATVGEAAAYADIGERTLYNYLKAYPDFVQRIEGLKGRPRLLAKLIVLEKLEASDLPTAWEVLDRGQVPGYQKPQEQPKPGHGGVQVNVLAPGQTPEGQAAIQVLHAILSGGRIPLPGHQGEGK